MKLGTYIVYNPALKEIDFLDKPLRYNDEVIGKIIDVKLDKNKGISEKRKNKTKDYYRFLLWEMLK